MEEGMVMSQGSSTVFHGRALRSFPIVCYAPTKTSSGGIWRGDNPLQFSFPVLLMQISLVFVFTRTLSFLSRPLNQPKVVTNILGGIILGPSVLGRRSQIVETWLFPQRSRTVVDTISMVIVTYFFFLIGVRMEPSLVKRASKKEISIGVFSIATAFGLGTAFVFLFKGHASPTLVQNGNLHIISWIFSTTSFPVLACLLYDYKFLNTEIGRISLISATVSESFNWMVGLSSIAIHASKGNSMGAILSVMSCVGLVAVVVGVVRPWMAWVVRSTPEEKKASEGCILTILVGVLTMAFLTELVGQRAPFGAFILGLAIPEGPPVGSAIVEKLDAIVSGSLMPLFYLSVGLKVDVFALHNFGVYGVLGMTVLVTEIGKIAGVVIPSINLKMPIREAFSIAFLMASKGLLEIVAFKVWKDLKIMDDETFTVLVLSVVIIAATCGPLSRHFHKLSKQSLACDGRTLQHSRHDPELRILACLSQEDTVPSLISLLHASHATKRSPITFYLLHLVELVGRASPLHLSYHRPKFHSNPTTTDRIANAFNYYTAHNNPHSSFHLLTSIAPFATMHEDICALAADKLVSLVVVPFHKRPTIDGTTMNESRPISALNRHVLREAPCSVGILVECRVSVSRMLHSKLMLNVGVLFLGGRHDREALAHAERIAVNPNVQMTVLRCIPACAGEGRESSLDEETMGQFRVACMDNERVVYKEKESCSGEETVSAIRSMGGEFDLFLVGRGSKTETQMTSGLLQWNEHPELGLIGDFLASSDYKGASSVLVVQQQPRSGPNSSFRSMKVDLSRV